MAPLSGSVAVVAGATRGAGRGIARMLGEAGAVVYCTGRSSRTGTNDHEHHYAGRPETIEETAELVDQAGGTGIAVPVDHRDESQVEALFRRVKKERKRLDVLVNVLTGSPVRSWAPFWKQSVEEGRALFDGWIWPHVMTCRHAVPLMVAKKAGLVVEIVEQEGIGFHGAFWFDLFEATLKRLAFGLAQEGRAHGLTALAITPGFMRTEAILEQFGATEATWREAAVSHAEAKRWGFIASETPCFVGRAVAALAADSDRARFSGGTYSSAGLADIYGFTDVDGNRPDMRRYMAEHHPALVAKPDGVRWELAGIP